MAREPIAEAFRLLQAGEVDAALQLARRLAAEVPANARAHVAMGVALRVLGKLDESRAALERAADLDQRDYAAAYELGATHEAMGSDAALAQFERAARLRPDFLAAHRAIAARHVAQGDFESAARSYEAALALAPGDAELSQLLAQVELLLARFEKGWPRYARREQRRHYESQFAAQGSRYRVPALAELAGRQVAVIGEQGLGDNLFFLRFAPALRNAGARLAFVGDERLRPLLQRTGLFESLHSDRAPFPLGSSLPVLLGDLPAVGARAGDDYPPSLHIPPLAACVSAWKARMEAAGPRPWIGVAWRAGMVSARGLSKQAPIEALFSRVAQLGGTVFSLQRDATAGELEKACRVIGGPVHDLGIVNDDLEDALAAVSLVDRHIGVSNTNMHLAAAADATADVLVPFPPEWRWGIAGPATPWFPGFRVVRQRADGDWREALLALES